MLQVLETCNLFFLIIRRPPRSTLLSLHAALPIFRAQRLEQLELALQDALVRTEHTLLVTFQLTGRETLTAGRSEEHTSELQSRQYLVCRLLLEKKKFTHTSLLWYLLSKWCTLTVE